MSLRLSIGSVIVLMVTVTSLLIGTVAFVASRQRMRTDLERRLGVLATALATAIPASEHATLIDPADMDSATWRRYRRLFETVQAGDERIAFIYTFRALDEGRYTFILDSGVGEDFSPLGTVYDETFDDLEAAFRPPYEVIVEREFTVDEFGRWLSAYAPILHDDGTLEGVLGIDMSASDIVRAETRLLILMISLAVVTAALGAAGGYAISHRIVDPLQRLADDMGRIRLLVLEDSIGPASRIKEVQTMQTALANMKRGLRSFKRYVPGDVVSQLINRDAEAVLGTEHRYVTVFFSDLENFTQASELLGEALVPDLLGPYLRAITEMLQASGATVDKFIGDAVMAFWGAPNDIVDHPAVAVRTALAVQRAIDTLRHSWSAVSHISLRTRIGMSSGEVMVGNIGYEERLSYTALGDTVNLAARLESLNKYYGTALLVAESTWDACGREYVGRRIDRVAVKGRVTDTGIYEILADPAFDDASTVGMAREFARRYEEAWDLYAAGRFGEAATLWETLLAERDDDGPTRLMVARARRYETEPPLGWTGVTIMQDK